MPGIRFHDADNTIDNSALITSPSKAQDENRAKEKRNSKKDLKVLFDNDEGRNMIRDSMMKTATSKGKREKEHEKMRKSFNMTADVVDDLKSCLNVKKHHKNIDGIKWRESKVLVQEMRISKVRASCWDDLFYTDEELAEFKYEAFMEECGLDPNDF